MNREDHQQESAKARVLEHWDLINKLSTRQFANDAAAEEAALWVVDELARDDWKKVRAHDGRASFRTYLSSVVYRLLVDFNRKKYGRLKPPAWVMKLGEPWIQLFQILCKERYPLAEALEVAKDRTAGLRASELENAAEDILTHIPHCGSADQQTVDSEDLVDHSKRPESRAERNQKEILLEILFKELDFPESQEAVTDSEGFKALSLSFTGDEKLLLKLCHEESMSLAAAGRMVGLNRFQVHGKMKRLYNRIREEFRSAGLEHELQMLLQE